MISSAVFARYARALADVALEGGDDSIIQKDLELYGEIFRAVPDLLETFDSPAIPREVKEKILAELLVRHPVSKTTANFLRVLLSHHRIRYFPEIYVYYTKTVNERKGIIAAQVTSAVPLTDSQLAGLKESLARSTGRMVTVAAETDADLVGGLVVQIGSKVYDGSIRKQLAEMRRRLTSAG
jgi:F-type H+-transporting ATPase subunit delta